MVPTQFGPIHAIVLPEADDVVDAAPCGIGVATAIEHLHHSFLTALVAVRLCDPPAVGAVAADQYAGLVDVLADQPPDAHQPDVRLIDRIAVHPWGPVTLDAIVRSGSVRQAARLTGIHHSTMQTRLEVVSAELGFDPFDGFGRARIGFAYLAWRLKNSRVLDLPRRASCTPPGTPPGTPSAIPSQSETLAGPGRLDDVGVVGADGVARGTAVPPSQGRAHDESSQRLRRRGERSA